MLLSEAEYSEAASSGSSNGRPTKDFIEVSTRSERRKTDAVREAYSTEA